MNLTERYAELIASEKLVADPAQEAALPLLDRVSDDLQRAKHKNGLLSRITKSNAEPVKGVYLWGGVGRGKSMLMDLFFESVPIQKKLRIHFHAFMQNVQSALHEARKTGVNDAIAPVADDIIKDVKLLCFDEMQITDIADAMIVGRLFERLFEAGVAVVTTSNRKPSDLYKDGLNRDLFLPFIDLLENNLVVHELVADRDYRQDRLAGETTYFTPPNRENKEAIDKIWADLTGGSTEPLELTVKGRVVEIPAYRNGAGRASFYDLCGRPLGPGDYLAIADVLRVLVLDDIPCLSRSNFNEAKRFVTLIDALYEGRVQLICSAADVPERLYLEGEGVFEFERTASRLREMQSAEWTRN